MLKLARNNLVRYGIAVVSVGAVLLLKLNLNSLINLDNPFLLFLGAVMVTAWFGGLWPGIAATLLSALAADYFFLTPTHTFFGHSLKQTIDLLLLFITEGMLISFLNAALQSSIQRANNLRIRAEELAESERSARMQTQAANLAKDQFLATVSHELRTPLTAILGWTKLLRSGKLAEDKIEAALATVERNAKTQAQLIEDLLDISRIISGKLNLEINQIQLEPIIEATINNVKPAADANNINIQMKIDPEVGLVSGDSIRLQQVVWNLVANAIKFTPRGGRIDVQLARAGSYIEICVSDTGIGISADFLPYVFDRFRQSDGTMTRRYNGLGIGLAIVRHIVEAHGGTVTVKSAGEGQGSTFKVKLPTAALHNKLLDKKSLPLKAEESISGDNLTSLKTLRILVVDDEPDTRNLLTTLLMQCDAIIKAVASTDEALTMMEGWLPDILVADIGMPEKDGYELIRQLRARTPKSGGKIPAIALTAYASSCDRQMALAAGYNLHLAKPIEPAELIKNVAKLAEQK